MTPEPWLGLFVPWLVYGLVLLLHLVLPARCVQGYVADADSGRLLSYRLNGLLVVVVLISFWVGLCMSGAISWQLLYLHRWWALGGAFVLGLIYSVWAVASYPATGRGWLADGFLGRAGNIQYLDGRIDAKMFLYLAGAAMLALNILSFAAHHVLTFGDDLNPGVLACAAMLLFFVFDYLIFERVHLYTYDLFAENVGFKLGWGCLVFYPYFYVVGLWATVDLATPMLIDSAPTLWIAFSAAVFLVGWMLARGANMQKYAFKRHRDRPFLGVIEQQAVNQGNQQLLCSGFWGVARHINYLGEILMATGITLSLGHVSEPWPWLYPLYYLLLLVPRERDDDARCAEKYGPLWDEYRRRVPYRIVPKLY